MKRKEKRKIYAANTEEFAGEMRKYYILHDI